MSLGALFEGMTEVRAALTGDRRGHVLEANEAAAESAEQDAATIAMAVSELDAASEMLGLGSLHGIQVRSSTRATLTAVAPDTFLFVSVDPVRRTAELEKRLADWEARGGPAPTAPAPTPVPASPAIPVALAPAAAAPAAIPPAAARPPAPPPLKARPIAPAPAAPPAAPAARDLPPPGTATGLPVVTLEDTPPPSPREDPWAALRRSLVRAHLSEAVSRLRLISEGPPPSSDRPGSEPLSREELGAALQALLEGIGSVMAGDTLGGTHALRELAGEGQRNTSIRWVALYWITRAALNGSGLEAARAQVEEALAISRQLDVEARALSQLVAAELLTRAGKHDKALTWIAEARSRFERVGDPWGLGQTWLVEARIQAACGQEPACLAAAARAHEADPAWDGPPIFLAGRALTRGDPDAAEEELAGVSTPAAARIRKLVAEVRAEHVSLQDAAEFLRLHHAAPTAQAIRALERIAEASPRFLQAREALAWMLVKLGKYAAARELFAWLEAQQLAPEELAGVKLGLSTVGAALAGAGEPQAPPNPAAPAAGAPAPPRLTDSILLTQAGGSAATGQDAVFSGRLSVFSLPDLVEFLRSARRTGQLVCSSPAGMGTLQFRKGWITSAASPSTPTACELLVRAGQVPAEAVQRIIAEDPAGGTPPCQVLVQRGLADPAAVQGALRRQIELTLRELVAWTDGEFAFSQETAEPVADAMTVQVDAQELLLTLFKEMDEAARGPSGA